MSTTLIVIIVIVVVLGLIFAGLYNGLVKLRNVVQESWAQIDVELKRRHDLIGNLVETVKGYASHERGTLDEVTRVRAAAMAPNQSPAQAAESEGALTRALVNLQSVTEAYPDLKATANVAQLQEELTSTENKIGFARQLYNDVATQYNTKQMLFPTSLIAGLAKAAPVELWQLEDAAERAVPIVDLSMNKPAP